MFCYSIYSHTIAILLTFVHIVVYCVIVPDLMENFMFVFVTNKMYREMFYCVDSWAAWLWLYQHQSFTVCIINHTLATCKQPFFNTWFGTKCEWGHCHILTLTLTSGPFPTFCYFGPALHSTLPKHFILVLKRLWNCQHFCSVTPRPLPSSRWHLSIDDCLKY